MVNAEVSLCATAIGSGYPEKVTHWLANTPQPSQGGDWFEKRDPHTGQVLSLVARGRQEDARQAVAQAVNALPQWQETPIVQRANLLRRMTRLMEDRREEIARIVHLETGKSLKDALGEVGAAIEMGYFIAGEGRRYYGRTTTSAVPNRTAMTVRQPVGVCALIIAANTPIANVAWKVFPALLCGNTAVLKASEDTPYSAVWFAERLAEAGLPVGVLSVLHGYGEEAGAPLVEDSRVDLVSFTGSVPVGRYIQKTAGERLAKVCLELGGKNALLVCDDADLDQAVEAAVLSAFSNAGQRCASGSRILVFDTVYDTFKARLLAKTEALRLGNQDADDFGPVINEQQLEGMLASICEAVQQGATLLAGGHRLSDPAYAGGYYLAPTVLENIPADAAISCRELFGPITCLYRVANFEEAVTLANQSPMGLTAAIHTASLHRAQRFTERMRTGVVSINGPTYGSEPHMPFGGLKDSGNGFREAGTEVLDVYSEWKTVYSRSFPEKV
jgi:aldehyde dehydrogenase (NAD+)